MSHERWKHAGRQRRDDAKEKPRPYRG
jgi:hypothetical protein